MHARGAGGGRREHTFTVPKVGPGWVEDPTRKAHPAVSQMGRHWGGPRSPPSSSPESLPKGPLQTIAQGIQDPPLYCLK